MKKFLKIIFKLALIGILIGGLYFVYNIIETNNFKDYKKSVVEQNVTEFKKDNDVKYSSKRSFKINSPKYNDAMISKNLNLKKNKSYKFSCMVKTENVESENNKSGSGAHISIEGTTVRSIAIQGTTDYSKTGSEIADYLIKHCRLSTYFTSDIFKNSPQKLGSPCYCYGKDCSMAHYERPEQPQIFGCDNVKPIPEAGMVPICLRSTELALIEPSLYFPNGMCALAVSTCKSVYDPKCEERGDSTCKNAKLDSFKDKEGKEQGPYDPYICSFAVFGDPKQLTSGDTFEDAASKIKEIQCPDDNVLVQFHMDIKIKIKEGDSNPTESLLDLVGCFQGCKTDADCRTDEYDFILQKPGEIKCMKADPNDEGVSAGICFDKRSVEFSDISPSGIKTINPGKYAWTD